MVFVVLKCDDFGNVIDTTIASSRKHALEIALDTINHIYLNNTGLFGLSRSSKKKIMAQLKITLEYDNVRIVNMDITEMQNRIVNGLLSELGRA